MANYFLTFALALRCRWPVCVAAKRAQLAHFPGGCRRISRDLLIRALAYRIQEQSLGGLKPSTRRLLAKVAADASARRSIQVAPESTLKPGTVLLREWHGTQHQVIVREDAIVFKGKQYKSLSQVAHRITGTKWSGPRFFGLKANREEQASGAN